MLTVLPEIYLHLIVATTYHNLGEDETVIKHIDEAIALCLPDGLLTPLIEYRTELDKLLDDRLALFDEMTLKKVAELHKQMIKGWIKLHNQLLTRNVSDNLSVREREAAKLAAFGLSNNEIAKRMKVTLSCLKGGIL